ncbi:sterol desaturase family protein [Candidatus Poriferisodalis sp.]|uniref:sterol desaturase family protein n=1 Tax=Candidatus Poriferisodalis sp. TaxID=3101277 RepID=UPI003B01F1C1
MTYEVVGGLVVVFSVIGALGAAAVWAFNSQRFGKYRTATPAPIRVSNPQRHRNIALNSTLSLACYAVAISVAPRWLYATEPTGIAVFAAQVVGALVIYDVLYYVMHRAMHLPRLMRLVHGVHHRVRYPTARDSLYLHHAELMAGIMLLLVAVAVVGPVSTWAFLTIVLVHGLINVIVHTNLVFPHPLFALWNHWVMRHHRHHAGHLDRNYATIFPFWDRLLGTHA